MTVKLLAQWGDYPIGALFTSTAETEAAMIASKQATSNLTGGITWPPAAAPGVPAGDVFVGTADPVDADGRPDGTIYIQVA